MIRTVALALPLALVLIASARANDLWKPGFFQTFNPNVFQSFYELPRTKEAATKAKWVEVEGPTKPAGYADVIMMVLSTSTIPTGIYFDTNGNLAGVVNALPVSCTVLVYDLAEQGLREWVYNGVTYYTHTVMFVPEDTTSRTYDENEIIQGDYLYYESKNFERKSAPRNCTEIKNDVTNIWRQQACIMWMGHHYYYNMTTSTSCDTAFEPIFMLYDDKTNQLIGFGFMILGCTCTGRPIENPTKKAVEMIVTSGPECLYSMVGNHSVCTVHNYFVNKPRTIFC